MKISQYLVERAPTEAEWRDGMNNVLIDGDAAVFHGGGEQHLITELPHDLPKEVHSFTVNNTSIKTLHGSPETCSSCMRHFNKNLKSLLSGPKRVLGGYYAHNNGLETLQGAPEVVQSFTCHDNKLQNLLHAPKTVHVDFNAQRNPIKSLHGIGIDYLTYVGQRINLDDIDDLVTHVLGLLLIKGQPKIIANFPGWEIITKYLNRSNSADHLIDCQHELIENGFHDKAQL